MNILTPAVYITLLVAIMVIDYKYHIIPNRLVYPGIVAALALSWLGIGWLSSIIGGAIFLIPMLVFGRFFKAGAGDIKLSLLIGLMIGYPFIFIYFLLLGLANIIITAYVMLVKHKKAKDELPFGAVMCVIAIATLLSGGQIWELITNLVS